MADLVTSVAANLIEVLGREAINKVCDMWGYTTQLEDLKQTVGTVKMVLLDADAKWDHLSNSQKDFIRKLRDVVYDADDVFDEFLTLAQLNLLDGAPKKLDKILRKVRRFFSSKNQVGQAYRMSCEVKDVKKKLDVIASDHAKFSLGVDVKPISRRPQETSSSVDVNDIIGRDKDKEIIVNMLLAPNASENTPDILAIVGVGGLGKTALAQLVYGDERIKQEFPDETFRLWVCVSDQGGEKFEVKAILCKILELVNETKPDNNSMMEYLQRQFEEKIGGKKFLLVLDDVWNENRNRWSNLENFLKIGRGGSKIIVTTRSQQTAKIIGSQYVHTLDRLSIEHSQSLFKMSAFGEGHELVDHNELVEIGKKIVEKCCNIPLALKVVGSLLYGQDIEKWQSIEKSDLAKIDNDNEILSILKFSYHNLEPSLKSCFSYCALFPKDFEIEKQEIIGLWMAQGYVVPLDGGQNLEDAAAEHFKILLQRCFFQDVKTDKYGDIKSIKLHDLMHDIAQESGGEEICNVMPKKDNMGDRIRHINNVSRRSLEYFKGKKKIRSYVVHFGQFFFLASRFGQFFDSQINYCIHLRVLILSGYNFKSLPDSIENLLHLRYLDLSENRNLEVLCESITKLYNLQTLNLSGCNKLRELPRGTSKLVNLRHLNFYCCSELTELTEGISKLVNLAHLNLNSCSELRELPDGISKLVNLTHLNLNSCSKLRELPAGISKLVNLRHLNLNSCTELRELPEGISKLVNLRHLNLNSCTKLRELPEGISKLVNLTHLILKRCEKLRELPKETSKLVNLRHLNIKGCDGLTSMPSGIDKLLNLSVLGMFVVGYINITNEEQSGEIGMLKDLKALNKIQGKMHVKIGEHYRNVEDINDNTIGYLKSMEYLRKLEIYFEDGYEDAEIETILEKLEPPPQLVELDLFGYEDAEIETILEKLEPPPQLVELDLFGYEGKRIGRWGRAEDNWAISLPFLVNINISLSRKLEQLPVLSKLPHLKLLILCELESMEYMENEMSNDTHASTTQFFPSLESLQIVHLRKLKGWWKVEGFSLHFPCLSTLGIRDCPNLASNIICPTLKSLDLGYNSERLQITYGTLEDDVIKLRTLALSQADRVKSIPRNCKDKEKENKVESLIEEIEKASQSSSSFLQELTILGGDSEEDDDDEPWRSFHNSLRSLSFSFLQRMELPKGMQHLTSLHSLVISSCPNIKTLPESFNQLTSLQSLAIWECPNIKTLPESFNQLTSLEELHIHRCPNIKTLPESFNQLTSLEELWIKGCPDLKERCRKPDGEDFPKIQHIPRVRIDSKDINDDDDD